jgi:hypothetical protein
LVVQPLWLTGVVKMEATNTRACEDGMPRSEMGVDATHRTGRDVASMLRVSGVDVGSSVPTNVASGAEDRCWGVRAWEQRIPSASGRPPKTKLLFVFEKWLHIALNPFREEAIHG